MPPAFIRPAYLHAPAPPSMPGGDALSLPLKRTGGSAGLTGLRLGHCWTVAKRFRYVVRADRFAGAQVRNRACNAQHSVISAR